MYEGHSVGVVVPAYNEAGFVGRVIDSIPPYVDRVYVIDDGSTDTTWEEIRSHAHDRNREYDGRFELLVVPIRHDRNKGVGGAIKTGYLHAREDGVEITAILGGDDQMDPSELTRYIDPIVRGTADYVKGNRFSHPDNWEAMPPFRLVGNVVLSLLTKIASGYWGIMDSQNGYTAISLDALRRTDIEGMYEYYGYCNDLLVRLHGADVRVADVPRSAEYAYEDGWKSHIDYSEYVPRVSLMLLRGFLRRILREYLLRSFHPLALMYMLGLSVIITGVSGLLVSLMGRSRDGPATWLLTTATGAVTFMYGVILDREDNKYLSVDIGSPASEPDPIERRTVTSEVDPDDSMTTEEDRPAISGVEPK